MWLRPSRWTSEKAIALGPERQARWLASLLNRKQRVVTLLVDRAFTLDENVRQRIICLLPSAEDFRRGSIS